MCGICGVYHFEPDWEVQEHVVQRMARTLVHRGPDDDGYYVSRNIALGHRRLSIIDLQSGKQPLSNESGDVVVIYNGEIYNFQHLRKRLAANEHRFRTRSDTECIVHGYEQWGVDVVHRLRGMFAFAIWDRRQQQLFLARDRLGKKPLYYYADGERFIFASEIKAILEADNVPRELSMEALADYLSLLYVPAPKTIYRHILKLPPGHWLLVREGNIQIQQYWDVPMEESHEPELRDAETELADRLEDSVQCRLISDVPLGAFLSGGLDSSTVVSFMREISSNGIITASIGFQERQYDELAYSRLVAEHLKTHHHEYVVEPDVAEVLPKLAWHLDEPHGDSSAIATFYVSKMARQTVTVALSGDGGDENFAGYERRYYYDRLENGIRNRIPTSVRRPLFTLLGRVYPKADWLPRPLRAKCMLTNLALSPERGFFSTMSSDPEMNRGLLAQDVRRELHGYDSFEVFEQHFRRCRATDPLSRIQYVDMKTFLVDDILMKVDKMSMANSLEVRCPLLDHTLVEYVSGLPSDLKLRGRTSKYILKRVMRERLPSQILGRRKHGFEVPISLWLRHELRDVGRELIVDNPAMKEYFDAHTVEKIWALHQRGRREFSAVLWSLLMFALWHDQFIQ